MDMKKISCAVLIVVASMSAAMAEAEAPAPDEALVLALCSAAKWGYSASFGNRKEREGNELSQGASLLILANKQDIEGALTSYTRRNC
ncbi:hypothetical protein O6P43_000127 [Quillaja saponaria]|uniref:Uncharacterized protein n=1 Tax=Quillaja saponaria TaxID=32244 RepID=A0AAD7QFX3_QUISA|nr:hypothetical protein O6P43_000127 [Quillaja saponaria]